MSAIDTFDWYTEKVRKDLDEKSRDFLKKQRRYLMDLRSEDERKRFVFQYISEIAVENGRGSLQSRGG